MRAHRRSSGAAGKGGKRAARRTVQRARPSDARAASCCQRRQAGAELGFARRERPPARDGDDGPGSSGTRTRRPLLDRRSRLRVAGALSGRGRARHRRPARGCVGADHGAATARAAELAPREPLRARRRPDRARARARARRSAAERRGPRAGRPGRRRGGRAPSGQERLLLGVVSPPRRCRVGGTASRRSGCRSQIRSGSPRRAWRSTSSSRSSSIRASPSWTGSSSTAAPGPTTAGGSSCGGPSASTSTAFATTSRANRCAASTGRRPPGAAR